MFTATIRDGALVLPEGADLGLSREGEQVQVAVEVADALDQAGLVFAATRPSLFQANHEDQPEPTVLPRESSARISVADWPAEQTAGLRSPRNAPGEADAVRIEPRDRGGDDDAMKTDDSGSTP